VSEIIVVKSLPRLVVIRTKGKSKTPVSETALWVDFDGLLKAALSFCVVEGVAPDKAVLHPSLGLWLAGGDVASKRRENKISTVGITVFLRRLRENHFGQK
jgi:hypothetical protein